MAFYAALFWVECEGVRSGLVSTFEAAFFDTFFLVVASIWVAEAT